MGRRSKPGEKKKIKAEDRTVSSRFSSKVARMHRRQRSRSDICNGPSRNSEGLEFAMSWPPKELHPGTPRPERVARLNCCVPSPARLCLRVVRQCVYNKFYRRVRHKRRGRGKQRRRRYRRYNAPIRCGVSIIERVKKKKKRKKEKTPLRV